MKSHRVAVILALAGACALMSGCSGPPQPVASTPLFSSEDEAFAAAEETYRNYVDALNQVDLSDPETFEAVYAWTTGEANAADRESFSEMHANGLTVAGHTRVGLSQPAAGTSATNTVELDVCLDVSDIQLVDAAGVSAIEPGRNNVQSMRIALKESHDSSTGLLISAFNAREGEPLCVQ